MQTRMAIYVATTHPLAGQHEVQADELHGWRELRLSTYLEREATLARGPVWSAPNYLLAHGNTHQPNPCTAILSSNR